MLDILWTHSVIVRLQNGTEKSFASIHDTIDFLENEWPTQRGDYYDAALVSCRHALARQTPPAVSRELFSSACLEAGFVIRGGIFPKSLGYKPMQPTSDHLKI
ncbi:DUF982 domain-containing protein [Rhizobium sp. S152]|uniref:DUF982 domain-containing protein n=1 Tax=Rhizobium sp. S152 TaxID=3055038 RepID=UPI0025A9BF41|nr:DUF982 domain-containing protein [Rhizobium sp. S152]MDM9629073.1 DUF982 domain-containing protein [Rhizobium sp. S152]